MIKVFGALASPAGAAPGGEAGACGKALLILMAPFVWAQMGLGVRLGAHCSDLAGRPEHLDTAPTHPREVDRDINNSAYQLL